MPGLLAPKSYDGRWLVDGALVKHPVPVSLAHGQLEADFVIAVHLIRRFMSMIMHSAAALKHRKVIAIRRRSRQKPISSDTVKKGDDEQKWFSKDFFSA